jgi:hypothetical protein
MDIMQKSASNELLGGRNPAHHLSNWDGVLQQILALHCSCVTVITAKGYFLTETGVRHYQASQYTLQQV